VPDGVRIDRIARLEKVKAAASALQAAESVRFAQSQAEEQPAANVHPDRSAAASPTSSAWHAAYPGSRPRVDSGWPGRCVSICRRLICC
jgi:hypothetical protein